MPSITIRNYRCTRTSPKTEQLSLVATVRGQERTITVDVGRYEKRPTFMVQHLGELCDYQAPQMRELLDQIVIAYHDKRVSSSVEDTL